MYKMYTVHGKVVRGNLTKRLMQKLHNTALYLMLANNFKKPENVITQNALYAATAVNEELNANNMVSNACKNTKHKD